MAAARSEWDCDLLLTGESRGPDSESVLDPGFRRGTRMTQRLANKIAIITGAGSGIGRAAAELFAREGAYLILADTAEAVEETAACIGPAAIPMRCDAGQEKDVAHLVRGAAARFGGLDIVFANAGISGGLASIFEQTPEDWQEILRVNLIGPFLAIKHAAPLMRERGRGSIICTASVAGLRAGAGGPAYSASKAGLINLVQVTATQDRKSTRLNSSH